MNLLKKQVQLKQAIQTMFNLYVVTGSISMAVMAEYIHNKNKKSITK